MLRTRDGAVYSDINTGFTTFEYNASAILNVETVILNGAGTLGAPSEVGFF